MIKILKPLSLPWFLVQFKIRQKACIFESNFLSDYWLEGEGESTCLSSLVTRF